jgi:hypothetical protein
LGDAFSPRLAVLRDRQISVCRRCRGAIAIAGIHLPFEALKLIRYIYEQAHFALQSRTAKTMNMAESATRNAA